MALPWVFVPLYCMRGRVCACGVGLVLAVLRLAACGLHGKIKAAGGVSFCRGWLAVSAAAGWAARGLWLRSCAGGLGVWGGFVALGGSPCWGAYSLPVFGSSADDCGKICGASSGLGSSARSACSARSARMAAFTAAKAAASSAMPATAAGCAPRSIHTATARRICAKVRLAARLLVLGAGVPLWSVSGRALYALPRPWASFLSLQALTDRTRRPL